MRQTIIIHQRFCGPPDSANGGYTAGLLAKHTPFLAQVTLRKPPPLGVPLQLEVKEKNANLWNEDLLIAEAKPTELELEVPSPPSAASISQGQNLVEAQQAEVFQDCFVCGKKRKTGDGLQIYPADVGPQKVACHWTPDASLTAENGVVATEFIWAALDCPGIWAIQDATQVYLLGRMATKILQPIYVGKTYTVMGWVIEMEGRKLQAGTAIYTSTGLVCAYAKSTWIKINN